MMFENRFLLPTGLLLTVLKHFFCGVDEDECMTGMAACGLHAACKNIPGYYKCFCPKGFTGDNPRKKPCLDVDECKKKVCHKDAICKNTIGSFTCPCKKGFQGDGRKSCVDTDECKVLSNKVFRSLCDNDCFVVSSI